MIVTDAMAPYQEEPIEIRTNPAIGERGIVSVRLPAVELGLGPRRCALFGCFPGGHLVSRVLRAHLQG